MSSCGEMAAVDGYDLVAIMVGSVVAGEAAHLEESIAGMTLYWEDQIGVSQQLVLPGNVRTAFHVGLRFIALEDVLVDGGLMDYLPHDGVGSCDGCLLLCPQV